MKMRFRTILLAGALGFTGAGHAFAGAIPLDSHYTGEERPKNTVWGMDGKGIACVPYKQSARITSCQVTYLTASTRLAYKLTWNGKLWVDQSGKPYDTAAAHIAAGTKRPTAVADLQAQTELGGPAAIWVMDPQINFYVAVTQKPGSFHHSSFMGGGLIQAGGQVVIKNGVITAISNGSGHYKPTKAQFMAALRNLQHYDAQGVWCIKSDDIEPGCTHISTPWTLSQAVAQMKINKELQKAVLIPEPPKEELAITTPPLTKSEEKQTKQQKYLTVNDSEDEDEGTTIGFGS